MIKSSVSGTTVLPIQRCLAGEDIRDLADHDLLAVIIGTGVRSHDVFDVSSQLLKQFGGLCGISGAGIRELSCSTGIGMKTSVRIHSAFEMGRRVIPGVVPGEKINTPSAAWKTVLPSIVGLMREEFRVLILNNKNYLLKNHLVSAGTVSETLVHPREIYREAVKESASSIVVVHNHPSGILTPSREDLRTTERIREAGRIMGIEMLDHVIVTSRGYLSLKEEGYIEAQ